MAYFHNVELVRLFYVKDLSDSSTSSLVADFVKQAHHKILDYFRVPLRLLIHLSQDVQHIWQDTNHSFSYYFFFVNECRVKVINCIFFSASHLQWLLLQKSSSGTWSYRLSWALWRLRYWPEARSRRRRSPHLGVRQDIVIQMLEMVVWFSLSFEISRKLPSLSSGVTSEEPVFTGRVRPASRDFSCTRSGFSEASPL